MSFEPEIAEARKLLGRVSPDSLAQRLRRARMRQGLSVRELAGRAGLSKTSVVRLEQTGRSHPKTVVAVCGALGLHLAGVVAPEPEEQVAVTHLGSDDRWFDMTDFGAGPLGGHGELSPGQRKVLAEEGLSVALLYLKNRLSGGRILPAVLEVYRRSESRSHPGEEMIYVLKGEGYVYVGQEKVCLREGECVTFWSAEEHSYAPMEEGVPVTLLSIRIDYQRGDS